MPAASLMDMFQPQSPIGEPTDFGSALQQRSNSLIGLGLGLLQPSRPGESAYTNALRGYMGGAAQDSTQGYRQAQLQHQKRQEARQAAMDKFHREQAGITDAQRAMKDVLPPDAAPEQKADFMRSYYANKTDPGGWILKDIIDPSDPDGERKITVQEHNRTGQIRPPQLPGQTGAAPGPTTNWMPGATNAPVYGQGGNYSATPGTATAAPAQPGSRRTMPIQGATGTTYQPPVGLSKEGRKAWENHVAGTEAKIAGGEITQDQGNASMYAGQMRIAEDLVTGVEKQGLSVPAKGAERLPFGVGNLFQSKEFQKYQSGKDAFINSKLRRQSGATIRDDEYYREEKIYFPQPGDDDKRIAYKRALRQDAIKRMEQAAGPTYTRPPSPDETRGDGVIRWGRDASGNPVPLP